MVEGTFQDWVPEFDRLCRRKTGNSWADLCGERPRMREFYLDGYTPEEAVDWWIEKYGLVEVPGNNNAH